jgi:hypothetical protein
MDEYLEGEATPKKNNTGKRPKRLTPARGKRVTPRLRNDEYHKIIGAR